MMHAGLDLSRKRLEVQLLTDQGERVEHLAVRPRPTACRTWSAGWPATGSRCRPPSNP